MSRRASDRSRRGRYWYRIGAAASWRHPSATAAIEPIIAEANAKLLGGDEQGAYDLYAEATRVQPSNPEAWFELGRFEANVLGSPRAAFPHLERFTELDPQGAGGELYRAVRKQVNAG
jgi:hypothetical protein